MVGIAMRRWPLLLTAVVAGLFVSTALPGSPVAAWLVRVVAGARPTPAATEPPTAQHAASPRPVLRAAVGAMVTPERTYRDYRALLAAVAERSGRELELVQRRTYRELNDLVSAGAVDLAWVCTGAFIDLAGRDAARIVAVPVVDGRSDYRSYLIVGPGSKARSLEDLRGAVFAFTEPLSLTGRRVVVDELARRNAAPEAFFRDAFFTFGHDSSIRAVREGLADAAAVDSLVYDFLAARHPDETEGLRVVWRSRWFPAPPVVVPASTDDGALALLQKALTGLGDDPETRQLLDRLRIDRFAPAEPDVYSWE